MAIKVFIPTPLRPYADGASTVEIEGRDVGGLLTVLTERYPKLAKHLLQENGELRSFVNVYVNSEDIRSLALRDTPLAPGDEVSIVPGIAGGAPDVDLSKDEIARYSRHLIMPEVTIDGQKRLKAGSVLLVGAGGLGSPMALYLAAAGVGRIGIVDFDVVDYSNLQRQILHGTADVGNAKLDSARRRLEDINPHIRIDTHEVRLTSENALDLFRDYDVIADGTDNFPTRYLVNDACVLLGKPNAYGSIFRFEGQASVFHHEGGPCYRCLYPEPPPPGLVPSCAEGGVLGILPGLIGVIQATEVVKILLGKGRSLAGRLLLYDALEMTFRELKLRRDPACPVCGENPTVTALIDYEAFCGVPGAQSSEETNREVFKMVEEQETALQDEQKPEVVMPKDIDVSALAERMNGGGDGFLVLDVRDPHEIAICALEDFLHIPMMEIPQRFEELDRSKEILCLCRTGVRSGQVAMFLAHQGFRNVRNVAGGIVAWAKEIDPEMPTY
ncbi:MAG: molybdopterin-synthase adenylyltransferase MoeB [Gemmatimonadetes bacterium]|nr:molybdopterin-synthase adenylyltransferase MoeB [Gemmatimonadota bacterium]